MCEHGCRISRCKIHLGHEMCKEHKVRKEQCKICCPISHLVCRVRSNVRRVLNRFNQGKASRTLEIAGCSSEELHARLDAKMKRAGFKWDEPWCLDHIKPVAAFAVEDMSLCNHVTNLQVLPAALNASKSARWSPTDERFWEENIILNDAYMGTYLPGGMSLPNNKAIEEDARDNATAI